MTFAATLVVCVALCLALRKAIHRVPWVFYGLAVAADIVYLYVDQIGFSRPLRVFMFDQLQEAILPLALFCVVMFIGCLPRTSKIAQQLRQIRGELSIVACILCVAHMVLYLMSYAPKLSGGGVNSNVLVSFAVAVVLLVLFLVLGVTSFNFVKRRMSAVAWKRVQRLAYPFFGLVYVHLLLMLLPAALRGGEAALVNVSIYTVLFVGYALWRTQRALADRRERGGACEKTDRKEAAYGEGLVEEDGEAVMA